MVTVCERSGLPDTAPNILPATLTGAGGAAPNSTEPMSVKAWPVSVAS